MFKNVLFSRLSSEHHYGLIHRNAMAIISLLAATSKPSAELAQAIDGMQRWIFCRTHGLTALVMRKCMFFRLGANVPLRGFAKSKDFGAVRFSSTF